ncbi:hypothetical protein LINPERHAP1_LOCUS10608, partial [Linum perenne]
MISWHNKALDFDSNGNEHNKASVTVSSAPQGSLS